jgi:hypothetical protein
LLFLLSASPEILLNPDAGGLGDYRLISCIPIISILERGGEPKPDHPERRRRSDRNGRRHRDGSPTDRLDGSPSERRDDRR